MRNSMENNREQQKKKHTFSKNIVFANARKWNTISNGK